jgi:putative solute:sodium symporter small subunit
MIPAAAEEELAAGRRRQLLAARAVHWRRTRRLTMALLAVWLLTSVGTVFFARQLAALQLGGWPLSFYMAAQGAQLIFLAILGGYALAMQAIDRRFARQLGEQL